MQKRRKLVSTDAIHPAIRAEAVLQALSRASNELVSRRMAQRVVHRLESVDVYRHVHKVFGKQLVEHVVLVRSKGATIVETRRLVFV